MKKIKTKFLLIYLFINFLNSQAFSSTISNKQILELSDTQVALFSNQLRSVCDSSKFYQNLNKIFKHKFGKPTDWKQKCLILGENKSPTDLKNFLIKNFKFKKIQEKPGLLTGYYEPIIRVSRNRDALYKFPILNNNDFYIKKPRSFIEKNFREKDVILWTNDEINLFFLHIQGSGIGELSNKKKVRLVYNGNNEMSYKSIGKILIKKNYINKNNVNLFTIKKWLRANPLLSKEILHHNKRFIFFKEMPFGTDKQPVGAFGIPLAADFSVAVDKNIYPLGLPFFIQIEKNESILPVISLDTGGAIVGPNRADLFFGRGEVAEKKAGVLKKKIYLHAFIPYSK